MISTFSITTLANGERGPTLKAHSSPGRGVLEETGRIVSVFDPESMSSTKIALNHNLFMSISCHIISVASKQTHLAK